MIVVDTDNYKRDKEIHKEKQHRMDLWVHVVCHGVWYACCESGIICVIDVSQFREHCFRNCQEHGDYPDGSGFETSPQHCTGGLDVHGIYNRFVPEIDQNADKN